MDLHHIAYARASEKLYESVRVIGVPEGCRLEVGATTDDGRGVPAKLFERSQDEGTREVLIVLPDLVRGIVSCTIVARDDAGSVMEEQSREVDFAKATWEARILGKTRRKLVGELRRSDEDIPHDGLSIDFIQAIQDGDEAVVRLTVRCPYEGTGDVTHDIRVLDRSLQERADAIFMGREVIPSRATDEPAYVDNVYSIRIRRDSCPLYVCVDETAPTERSTFEALYPDRLASLLDIQNRRFMNAQLDPYYEEWLARNKATEDELEEERNAVLSVMPTFSIVVPLFRTPKVFFEEMLESVLEQSYARWQLILVNASPENAELAGLVDAACASDARVTSTTLEENFGISENTNAGIDLATGDFVCFFDHDDLLEPDLLFQYAKAINEHPETDLLYCDEDKVTPDGRHIDPFFKPDFSIDLLRNNNYVCHLLCIRKTLLDRLPRNTREYDGAQDHNLTLLAYEHGRHIHHVDRMLYHWRISATSTAGSSSDKPYATQAGIRAVTAHLERLGIPATVTQNRWAFTYEVRYHVPEPQPLVSVIIPTCDHHDILEACVESVFGLSTYDNFEVIAVENNSTQPETFECYERLSRLHGERFHVERWEGGFNFSAICNFGASRANGEYLLFLNNDTEVITPDWMERLVGFCSRDDVGAVGCRLIYPDDTTQHAGIVVSGEAANLLHKDLPRSGFGYFNLAGFDQDLSAVTAACVMVRRDVFDLVAGFDETLAVSYNDVDFCLRIREKGLLVVYTPQVEVRHYETLSRGRDRRGASRIRQHAERALLNERWARMYVDGDPSLNRNLRQDDPYNCWYHL